MLSIKLAKNVGKEPKQMYKKEEIIEATELADLLKEEKYLKRVKIKN